MGGNSENHIRQEGIGFKCAVLELIEKKASVDSFCVNRVGWEKLLRSRAPMGTTLKPFARTCGRRATEELGCGAAYRLLPQSSKAYGIPRPNLYLRIAGSTQS